MGATLAALEARGLIGRAPDPDDGRRAVMSITDAGLELLRSRRAAKVQQLARALSTDFTPAEVNQLAAVAPLLERLAQSI
jgi:DNA-binding MarR family transcriptional regulator